MVERKRLTPEETQELVKKAGRLARQLNAITRNLMSQAGGEVWRDGEPSEHLHSFNSAFCAIKEELPCERIISLSGRILGVENADSLFRNGHSRKPSKLE